MDADVGCMARGIGRSWRADVVVCAGDHYDNHTDTAEPTPTPTVFSNKISNVFICCLTIIITSYSANYSRFLRSIFCFFKTFSFDIIAFDIFFLGALVTISRKQCAFRFD
jgi:hypothetical protein